MDCRATALTLGCLALCAACGEEPEQVVSEPEVAEAPDQEQSGDREGTEEPAPEEPTIAHGIAKVERVFVRQEPREDSRAVGIIRWGQRFEVSETQEIDGVTWHRMKGIGWLVGEEVNTRQSGPATLGFIPVAPRLDSDLPYRYTLVTAEDGVPVYRRPPRRGEDPERVRTRDLQKGYFFTIDKFVNIYDRQLYRTTRYWFIPRDGTTPVTGPGFHGIEVNGGVSLPFLWVTDPTARLCEEPVEPGADPEPPCEPVERHTRLPLLEQRDRAGTWYRTENGWIASLQVARVFKLDRRPNGVGPDERWIHVDLRNQFAGLYQGDNLLFVTLVSSGDDDHATPSGTYQIESMHITATMDDEDNLSGPYFIQDVPWVLYFRGGYALHGAFWHDRFGLKTSHGCINLAPADARRFFNFVTSPTLPEGMHAVFTPPGQRGTTVHITE